MDSYLARQAVFDRSLAVTGYELLFRSGAENVFTGGDHDQASARVIESSMNTFGFAGLCGGRKGFIIMTRGMILQGYAALLPAASTVLEIPAGLEQDAALVEACAGLRRSGFQIALDEFRLARAAEPLVPHADILKVDFQAVPREELRDCVRTQAGPKRQLLAKKVETRREMSDAMDLGFGLYQGFFFCRPELAQRREIPPYKLSYLRLLREINREDADFDALEDIIRQDVALSLKLLRYINSAAFSLARRVESIKQALTLVGLQTMKRWASLLAMAAMSDDRPKELIVTSLVRASFCERVGTAAGMKDRAFDLFMVGMLSAMDAVLDRPMNEILKDLPLSEAAKDALLGKGDGLGRILGLALAYERAEWDRLPLHLDRLKVDVLRIPALYRESIAWAEEIFKATLEDK
jgi:EAL and modified HD-GYP domain-containing signal transduction protein